MYEHEWFWYIADPLEAKYCLLQQREYQKILDLTFKTNFQKFIAIDRILKDVRYMARKKKDGSQRTTQTSGEMRWLNIPITDELEPQAIKWMDDNAESAVGLVCAAATRGFSVSIKPGRDNDYMATVYGAIDTPQGAVPFGVSAFAISPDDAIGGVLFKFIVLLDWGASVSQFLDTPTRRFR